MDFIIALFGGLYYGGLLLTDRSERKLIAKEAERKSRINEEIRETVQAPSRLESAIQKKIFSGEFVDEIREELRDDFAYVYGDPDASKKLIPNRRINSIWDGNTRWIFELLLAHRGKVSNRSYSNGFIIERENSYGKKTFIDDIRFCKRIEEHLNNNGVDLKLYLNPICLHGNENSNQYMVFEHQVDRGSFLKRLW